MSTQSCGLGGMKRDKKFWRKNVICLLGVVVWLSATASPATAKLSSMAGGLSCATSGCHLVNTSSAVDQVAVKAGAASWVTYSNSLNPATITGVPAGSTIELEWIWTNLNVKKGNTGAAIAVPTGWSATPNTNAGAGGLSLWDATYQSTTWYGGGTPTLLTADTPSTHDGYATDYTSTPIASLNTLGLAIDDPGPDGTAAQMGAKVTVTIPAGAATNNYTIIVHGSGHTAVKESKITTITLSVVGAADSTKPTVDSFTATTPVATNVDIPITAFTASDNVGVTGYMITESVTPPGSGDAGWGGAAPATYTSAAGDGTKTLYPWAKDAAGNVSNVYGSPASVLVDGTAPTTTDNAPAGWQTADVTVILTPTDGGSGVASTEYCIDTADSCTPGTSGTSASVTQTAGTAGTQYVRYRSTDNVGNVETTQSSAIQIDKAFPSTTDDAPAGWQSADVTVTLTPSDTGSGVADTEYCIDTSDSCTPGTSGTSASVTQGANTEGTQYVRYRSTDNAGNVETTQSSETIQIDKKGPTDGTLTVTPGNTLNDLSWTAASDAGSGLRTGTIYDVRFLQSGTPPTCATGTSLYTGDLLAYSHTGLSNGTQYSYRVCAYDAVDNPSVGATGSGTPTAGNSNPNAPTNLAQYKNDGTTAISSGSYTNETTVKIEADISDPDSGDTVKLQVDIDANGTSDCESTLAATPRTGVQVSCSVTNGNSYDWQVRTVDNSSATSAWVAFVGTPDFTVDTTAPSVTTTSPADTDTGVALNSDVTINFTDGPIDCATVDATNITSDSPGWAFSSCSDTQAVFTTTGQSNSTTYNVNVTTAVADQAGNALSAAYPFSYTTAGAANQPPTDITLSPDKVSDGTDTSGGFDMALDAVDPDGGDTFTKTGAGADAAKFSISGSTLTLTDGVISFDTPGDANADGVYEVEVQVEDSATNTYTETLNVTITPAYNPMIHSSLSTGSSKWSGDWGTTNGKYGEFTCSTCHARGTGNIKRIKTSINSGTADKFPNEAGLDSITFTSTVDGSSDFGNDNGGHSESNSICEACHSQNKYHNYDTADNITNGGDLTHENLKDCISCHRHSKGFAASCDACHGNPPITPDIDGSTTTGLVHDPSPTSATSPSSAGAHELHGVTEAMSCTTCHKGNTMPTVSMTVQMGFEVNSSNWSQFTSSATGGNIDTPLNSAMLNSYTFVSSDGGTTNITKVATHDLNCTVYCHGNWVGSGGSNTTPSWVGSSGEAACGACHGISPANPPTAGSHPTHAGNGAGELSLSCIKCHPTVGDKTHLDGDVAWELDTADSMIGASATYRGSATGTTGGKAPSASYGDCSSTYCHGVGTPTWGGTVNCGDCHAVNNILPISHGTHYGVATTGDSASDAKVNNASVYVYQCGSCHDSVPHADGNKDVAMSATWSGTIDGTLQCSNVYCHSDGVNATGNVNPTWAVTNMTCGSCHDAEPASARHTRHTDNGTYNFNCVECHAVTTADGISIADTFQHVDKDKDVDWDTLNSGGDAYTNASTTCSNLYCHSNGQGGAPLTSVQWDTVPAAFGCNDCHDEAQTGTSLSGAHEAHIVNAETKLGRNLGCEQCHNDTVSNSTTISDFSIHVDNNKDIKVVIDGTTCSNIQCHSNGNIGNLVYNNPDFAVATIGCDDCHGDGAGKSHPTYVNGGAGINANSHLQHVETSSIDCGECHADTSTAGTSLDGATPAKHVDQAIDVVLGTGSWNGTNDQCSSTYCHGAGTPTWGGTVNCGDCHAVNNTLPISHDTHYGVATTGDSASDAKVNNTSVYVYQCGSCHDSVPHADGNKDVTMSATWSGTINGTLQCSNVYCHSDGVNATGNVAPTWAVTNMTCGSCHDAEPATGDHTTHVDTTYNFNCTECHNVTTSNGTTIADTFQHTDKTKDIDISATYDGNGGTGNWDGANCSSVYCHSDGKASPTYYTVASGSGPASCTFCHGGSGGSVGDAGNALSTSHTIHTGTNGTTQFAYTCDDCHVQTASNNTTISNYTNHVNVARDVAVSAANGGTGGIGGDYNGTGCSTIDCHGSDSAGAGDSWAAGGTTGDCSFCHGMSDPGTTGRDTNGNTANTDAQVGAHVAHLTSATNYTADVACDECHIDPDATAGSYMDKVKTANHMSGLPADMTWGTLTSADSATVSYSGGNCTNYCHGDTLNGGTATSPAWDDPTYLDGSGKAGSDCDNCHGAPPTTGPYNHNGIALADDCAGCHDHNGSAATHIDGTLDANVGCVDCHAGGGPGAQLVSVDSTHSTNTIAGSPTCESCHFDAHSSRTTGTVEIPWDTRTMGTLTASEDALDGIIYIKAYQSTTLAGNPTATVEAEACWYCHADEGLSEWNSTADADPNAPGVRPTGSLTTGVSWIGTNWQSANFGFKTGAVESVHETQNDTAVDPAVHDTTGGAGSHNPVTSANTAVADISCGVCHDVHSIGDDNADAEPAPYLRGGWTTNPFPEDGAPRKTNPDLTASITSFGGVPRGGLGTSHPLSWSGNNALGGWQIEQNNSDFSDTSYVSFGGLCQKCHTQGTLETNWAPHAAVVSGFTGGGSNIFRTSYRSDSNVANYGTWKYALMRHDNTSGGANSSKPTWVYGLRNPETSQLPSADIGGITPTIDPDRPETGADLDLSTLLGVSVDDGSTDTGYHSFPCSKCHTPHASRLPKLMVTNCLDVAQNDWDDTIVPSGWGYSAHDYTADQLAYSPTAVNCHRYVAAGDTTAEDKDQNDSNGLPDDYAEPGWNNVTPW